MCKKLANLFTTISALGGKKMNRPYPIDLERQARCQEVLKRRRLNQSSLAFHLGLSKTIISHTISGRRPSVTVENRIARFLGVSHDSLFPERSMQDYETMREREQKEKDSWDSANAELMAIRERALQSA